MITNWSIYRKIDKKLASAQRVFVKSDDDVIKYRTSKSSATMAVPKKKTSKGKRNQRHAIWKGKAAIAAEKALSIGKSVLTGRAQGFVYPMDETSDNESE